MTVAAVLATVVLGALAVLQTLVAAGRPYGRLVWGGQHETLPRRLRVGSAASVAVYAAIAWVLLARAGVVGTSTPFVGTATWVLVGYFAVGTAVNAVSRSRAEQRVMTPTCLVLTACSLTLALG